MSGFNDNLDRWTVERAKEVYGIHNWSAGYFDISEAGHITVTPGGSRNGGPAVSMMEIIAGIKARGFGMPVLLRIQNVLDSQLTRLHDSFQNAMRDLNYKNVYRGVYPIKVNQQQQVLEEVTKFGSKCHHGLEAGSKAELIAAISMIKDPEACLICNGYKDEEFIELGLYARKMGMRCFFVVEMPSEIPLIVKKSKELNIMPLIGIRIKLSTKAGGQWTESSGDRSVFGLSMIQIMEAVDYLKKNDLLDCLKLLHYHIGSQIPNIRDIRAGVLEAARIYAGLCQEGAPMGYLDLGGGLAVDYDGSHTNFPSSRNYTTEEYCVDIIETVMETLERNNIPHPVLITESGRATVAYYSVLLFNILDVSRFETQQISNEAPRNCHEQTKNMFEVFKMIKPKKLQECYHDAIYYRDEIRERFKSGEIGLRERSLAESVFWNIMNRIASETKKLKYIPDEFEHLDSALSDIYYGNFSVFQSLPDSWAIKHLFPIVPVHRLDEQPSKHGILADITCDCDGKIDNFIDLHDVKHTLPLHEFKIDEEYYLGVFLVGAYQETLGDLHNLLGDTNVVSIRIHEDGKYDFVKELEGDSVADVLSYVEYDIKALTERVRETAEGAIQKNMITPQERREIMDALEAGLRGYTYFER